MPKILRVFPRATKATPTDEDCRIATMPNLFDEADRIDVSVTFSWDIPYAEKLAEAWKYVAPVNIGGPAYNLEEDEFIPGKYLKHGYVITSRGCGHGCWFCREKNRPIKELEIKEGNKLQDSNFLATSKVHQQKVFEMLARQKEPVEFTGGLEAALLTEWHIEQMSKLKISQVFSAYDDNTDYDALCHAGKLLSEIGINYKSRKARCYVLCGFPNDTILDAEKRMVDVLTAGFMPMAMLYRNHSGDRLKEWQVWQRQWARPAIISCKTKEIMSL